ncbi:MAG TPA: MMPL family transporter [Tepidisphaeraceae bacterium]|jgi:hypothetical protein
MGFVQRRLVIGVLGVVARPKLTLGIAAVVLIVCAGSAYKWLTISSDQNKLFSPKVKFFADWLDFDRKFPENQATYVVIEPASLDVKPLAKQWVEVADAITARLRAMPEHVGRVVERVPPNDRDAPGILFQEPKLLPESFDGLKGLAQLANEFGGKPSGVVSLLDRGPPLGRYLGGMNIAPSRQRQEGLPLLSAVVDGLLTTVREPNAPMQIGRQVPDVIVANATSPDEMGYFFVSDSDPNDPPHDLLLIRVFEREHRSGLTTAADTIEAIRKAVEQEGAKFPLFKVGLTGRPVLDADEDRMTDRDGRKAEILALSVVFIGLVVAFRSIWLALVAEITLAVAIGWTFGWATLSIGQLNLLSTVFLIALIGIGMDYLIQIMAAYRREARRYVRPEAVFARVFRYVGPPVNTACLGAAGAFLVSALTDFKGAAELGIIAGGGLLLCLVAGYTVLPAILVLFPPKLKPYPASARYGEAPPRSAWRLWMPLTWIVLVLAGIPFMMRAEFNPNLLDLQSPGLPSVKLVRKLQTWEAVVLSKDLDTLRRVRDAVEGAPTVAGTESILRAIDNREWLAQHAHELPNIEWTSPTPVTPGDLNNLAARARALANTIAAESAATRPANLPVGISPARVAGQLMEFADAITSPNTDAAKVAAALSAWQVAFVDELKSLMAMATPPPVDVAKLPEALREHLASSVGQPPGQYVYALYIQPKADLWQRENLRAFVRDVESRVAAVPGAPDVTGIASDIYHSTASIERAFYHATAYALILIFILVLIDLRSIAHTLIAVSVLALGLPMLVALMGLMGASWNFANFFGLPILIGAGHEYGVFLMHRYREALHNPRRVWRRWDPSDRALLLCAFVTCSSFGFFWLVSHHLGLRSLGMVMTVGTLCIYLAAYAVVRSLLTWRLETRRQREQQAGFDLSTPESSRQESRAP